eukprot:gene25704-biopygen3014
MTDAPKNTAGALSRTGEQAAKSVKERTVVHVEVPALRSAPGATQGPHTGPAADTGGAAFHKAHPPGVRVSTEGLNIGSQCRVSV